MAKYVIEDTTLVGIADAIRAKTGDTAAMKPADFPQAISAITGGAEESLTALLEEQTLEFTDESGSGDGPWACYVTDVTLPIVVGETYRVLWDGVEYECVAEGLEMDGGVVSPYIGNLTTIMSPSVAEDTGQPFFVMYGSAEVTGSTAMYGIYSTNETSHTAVIYQVTGGGSSSGSAEGVVYVTYMNGDTELCKTACLKGDSTVDPVVDGKIAAPTLQLTDGQACTFFGWSHSEGGEVDELALTDVDEDTALYASFIIAKGTGGTNMSWRLYSTGLMVIDGEGAMSDYTDTALADSYKQYVTQVVVKEGVTVIGESAFEGYSALQSVTLPESVTAINNYAFLMCPALQSVNIPGGVSVIKAQAFAGCSALEHIAIPAAVTQIQMNAFSSAGLTSAVFENPNGWTTTPGIFAGVAATLSAEDLSDPATAAAYLTSGDYCDSTWNRS